MAYCTNCHKGISYGHAVSHAKNRVRRFFRPNIQKIKLLRNGISVRVKLCTTCIKTLRKKGRLGLFTFPKVLPAAVKLPEVVIRPPTPHRAGLRRAKEEKAAEKLQIEDIVGKKS